MLRSLALLLTLAGIAGAAEPAVFHVKTLTAQMKYDVTKISVAPGTPVKIVFDNGDDLPHNMVFLKPGTDGVALSMKQMEKPDEGVKRNWLPDDPSIWLHSSMLNPHQSETLTFTAPEKKGDYPWVCTFPGHALTMRGSLKVMPRGEGLKDLKFKLYLGDWKQLPEFSKLTPHREGAVADNLIQVKLDDYKNQFGVVFDGMLNMPRDGNYRFFLSSDDGARILIDGNEIVAHDGIHPASDIKSGMVKLPAGPHPFRLEYFQAAGQIELFAAWKGADFDITPLSKWLHPGWKTGAKPRKNAETTGMPLVVTNEPVVYRNFIAGAGTRGIGVGYPGGFNIAWSAETMNLALVWRGAFIDAARHWNSRGGGYQPPLGYDVVKPAGDGMVPLAIPQPGEPWPVIAEGQRDGAFAWKGYRLDARRSPVFHYTWKGVDVEDRFETEGNGTTSAGRLIRTVKISGAVPKGALLLVAAGNKIDSANGAFTVDGGKFSMEGSSFNNVIRVSVEGGSIAGSNLVVPVRSGETRITYSWP